jgi:hypothetical protein
MSAPKLKLVKVPATLHSDGSRTINGNLHVPKAWKDLPTRNLTANPYSGKMMSFLTIYSRYGTNGNEVKAALIELGLEGHSFVVGGWWENLKCGRGQTYFVSKAIVERLGTKIAERNERKVSRGVNGAQQVDRVYEGKKAHGESLSTVREIMAGVVESLKVLTAITKQLEKKLR